MKRPSDVPQPIPEADLLRSDDASRTRYFEEALDALERLWTRNDESTRATDSDATSRR